MRRVKIHYQFVTIALCVVLLFLFGTQFADISENINNIKNRDVDLQDLRLKSLYKNSIESVFDKARFNIKSELVNYNFNASGVKKLEDLLMESGGNPIRSIIVSSWRSGSTFLGDLLNSVPSTFYHYEPFLKHKINQIRGSPNGDKAIEIIKKMLMCNFENMDDYFEFGKTEPEQFSFNSRLWEYCKQNKELCYDSEFTERFCKLFPFQSMKLVRVRLPLFGPVLEERKLNAKIVLLVRDPRGLMQSRQHRTFCVQSPDCWNLKVVCDDMTNDYRAAKLLMQQYPDKIMALRFEDFALNVNETTRQLLKFLRLDFTRSVKEFLLSHTGTDVAGVNSTIRVTRDVPFKWRKILYFSYVKKLQESCEEAMNLWGYDIAHNASHMISEDFNPIKPYSL